MVAPGVKVRRMAVEYEKKTTYVRIRCTPTEKKQWQARFPFQELSRAVRSYLNKTSKAKP